MTRVLGLSLVLLVASAPWARPVAAQDEEVSAQAAEASAQAAEASGQEDAEAQDLDAREARRLFEQGTLALTEERYAVAERLLARSIVLHPHPATAYNLGVAQARQGRSHDAVTTLERLLADHYGPIDARQRREATELIANARSTLATLLVEVRGGGRGVLRIDGVRDEEVDGGAVARVLVDGGEHRLELLGHDGRLDFAEVTVEPGAALSVRLDGRALRPDRASQAAPAASPRTGPPADEEASGAWLWVGIVAAVVVVAAAGIGAWLLWGGNSDLVEDPVWGNTLALGGGRASRP